MPILVNGEPRDVEDGTTLSELISSLQLKPEQIAVELNRKVVRRAEWPATILRDGDSLEIVHFVGGGGISTDYADYKTKPSTCLIHNLGHLRLIVCWVLLSIAGWLV